jgi:hypothetical protein
MKQENKNIEKPALHIQQYTQPFTGDTRVQFSDTEKQDDRFIRADAADLVLLEQYQ